MLIDGTAGDDFLTGNPEGDTINGLAGTDRINGNAGADVLNGGDGNDLLYDGALSFSLSDGSYQHVSDQFGDTLNGGAGDDRLYGSIGDSFIGGSGFDTMSVGIGFGPGLTVDMRIVQAGGTILIHGIQPSGPGFIVIPNGAQISGIEQVEYMSLTMNADTFYGTTNADRVDGYEGDDQLFGLGGDDVLDGYTGTNTLDGGDGNDILGSNFSSGVQLMFGGAGNDEASVIGPGSSFDGGSGDDTVSILVGGEIDLRPLNTGGAGTIAGGGTIRNVEHITINAFSDDLDFLGSQLGETVTTITGTVFARGGSGDDVLTGAISGLANADTLFGDDGDDLLSGLAGDDVIEGGTGNDTLNGGDGDDIITDTGGDDVIDGGAGDDLIADLQGQNTLLGGDGDDYIIGRATDTIDGGQGRDILEVSFDTVATPITVAVTQNSFTVTGVAMAAVNLEGIYAFAGSGADTYVISGVTSGEYRFSGYDGDDTLEADFSSVTSGVDLNESFIASFDGMVLVTLTGIDLMHVTGTGAADRLHAGGGTGDILNGADGADVINGGFGAHTLNGGAGDDRFEDIGAGSEVDGGGGLDQLTMDIGLVLTPLNFVAADYRTSLGAVLNGASVRNMESFIIAGGNGDDTFRFDGLLGPNVVIGGAGIDSLLVDLSASTQAVFVSGGIMISDSAGGSLHFDALERVEVHGGSGNDVMTAGSTAAEFRGGDGNDTLTGGSANDVLRGETGDDIYRVNAIGDFVFENFNEGVDRVDATISYVLGNHVENLVLLGTTNLDGSGNVLANVMVGNTGNNSLYGGTGDDTLFGNDGNDRLDGATGSDTMKGGFGDDIYIVDSAGDVVTDEFNGGLDRVDASVSYTLGSNVESLVLQGAAATNGTGNFLANTMVGNAANNSLYGGTGDDTLFGNDGNDRLDGATGNDIMKGGFGDDIYIVDSAGDVVTDEFNGGLDRVDASVSYALGSNVENLVLLGTASLNGSGNFLNNTIVGNTAANSLYGGTGDDILFGNDGNDRLDGSTGNDTMKGGLGDDIYIVDSAGDVTTEDVGQGTDRIDAYVSYTIGVNIENMVLQGAGNINGTGNFVNNTIIGNGGDNILSGLGGNDMLLGGAGNDRLDGGAGNDTMTGAEGNDVYVVDSTGDVVNETIFIGGGIDRVESSITYVLGSNVENLTMTGSANINGSGNFLANTLIGNSGNNVMYAGSNDDVLIGGDGNDTLSGADGDDWLEGGAGNDILNGDPGSDFFVFSSQLDVAGIDTISGFQTADMIYLDGDVFTSIGLGALASDAFVIGTAAAGASDRIIFDPTSHALYYDADGAGGASAIQIATIFVNLGETLSAENFFGI